MVGACDRREPGQKRRPREDALRLVGVQPHVLPLVGVQRPSPLPRPRIDRDAADIMDQPRAPDRGDAVRVDPAATSRSLGQPGDTAGVAGEIR